MPKKHQKRVLFIKPQSSSPHTLSLSKSPASRTQNGDTPRTVNDLIRESRRQQLKNDTRATTATNVPSIHPSLRAVLDLPDPPTPAPRPGFGPRAAGGTPGPSRLRRIPGPPPPQSWLADSSHAPASVRAAALASDADTGNGRIQVRSSNLPDGAFPSATSLQHLLLKNMACNWEWHAENDRDYFEYLPVSLREKLLSYIAVYSEEITSNPLRILFLNETSSEDRAEVRRLDLSNALGAWTTLKQLERDLLVKNAVPARIETVTDTRAGTLDPTPDSWDADADSNAVAAVTPTISSLPKTVHNFGNLKHLSLAISPSSVKAASWASLLSLASELNTLTSLSLAYWPQPTFTPNAASTRALIDIPGSRSVVYGGSDFYTSFDNDWREAAGILRTLSRSLYCLKWLDLTGCGDWFAALEWTPPRTGLFFSHSSSPPNREKVGPEWNSGWRGLETLVLEVGWRPIPPAAIGHGSYAQDEDIEAERRLYRYKKERERFDKIRNTAQSVARYLRNVRKEAGGKWIEVEYGEDLVTSLARDRRLADA
ncbi:uncharacterized protein PV07_05778 [Cladophialophora immunda]|uniref:Tafazzin n=1 Tax=Cladophialophora immunda TaxID=569365 RepID=A0A0D2AXJ9_9EURO|nr:uncharacterized protein PV07_05778 [Cladophialophora immunda]KIW29997.1 hypothetical protein PV07_05778 [Cladophialophora immunda]OQV08147.1 hypothetical protein CLAIMM_12461 [Cladophialophora immunda]